MCRGALSLLKCSDLDNQNDVSYLRVLLIHENESEIAKE